MFYNEKIVDKYLDALEKEIDNNYKKEVLDTIYIGGGTPSSLSLKQLDKLFKILSKLNKSKNLEYTIENNFENINYDKLNLYKKYGINRLSFGIESINNNNLKLLERTNNINKIKDIITYSKSIGFNNINVDLMYALPNEDISILKKDLEFIYSLDIEHISTYSLIIEEHTKLSINKTKNINEDLDYEMYKFICTSMKNNNYDHYEISNFSKPNYYSKHNTCYWLNNKYYGFGLGASSYIDNKRITNTRSINKYLSGNYISTYEEIDKQLEIEYEVILNLRKSTGINLKDFYNKYNINLIDIYNYNDLIKDKLLVLENDNLLIPEDKWYISNEIIVRILGSEING
jgi:oxygen-independent coproporphyrinogen-3 oxidase